MGEFSGKVVIVTAAAGAGIGQETARGFPCEGANVLVGDAHPKDHLMWLMILQINIMSRL